jgi:predicted glutamine amidotransferase
LKPGNTDIFYKAKECDAMEMQDALLIQQLRQRQQLKQECLRENDSPLHQEAEKLLAMSKVAMEADEALVFTSLLKKEQKYLESILHQMRDAYDSMPQAMQKSAAGEAAKTSLMLTTGALHRLQAAEKVTQKELSICLEEAAFLLEGADGRM